MEKEKVSNEQSESNKDIRSQLNTITPLSKYLAMMLFVALPFLGGWIGYTYAPEKVVEVEKIIVEEIKMDSPNLSQSQLSDGTAEIVTNNEYEFSFSKPTGWQLEVKSKDNGWEEYVLTPAEQFDTSDNIIVSISSNSFESAATVPATLFNLELPHNWPPSRQRLICEPSDDELPVEFARTEENLREFCRANTRLVTIFTDVNVGDNFVWSISAKYEAENDQIFEEAINNIISSFQHQKVSGL